MEYDYRESLYQEYTAEMLGMLVRCMAGLGGNKIELPTFRELVNPHEVDRRTAEQIKNDVLAKLLK